MRQARIGKKHRAAGFSTLDFTNSLSALALLFSAGVSGVYNFVADLDRADVVNQMITGLRLARTAANQYSMVVTLCPSADGRGCSRSGDWSTGWVAFIDKNRDGDMDPDERRAVIAKGLNPPSGVRVASDWDRLSFSPGEPVPQGEAAATLCVRDSRGPAQSRVIWIDSRGRVQVQSQRPDHEQRENIRRDFSHRSKDCY